VAEAVRPGVGAGVGLGQRLYEVCGGKKSKESLFQDGSRGGWSRFFGWVPYILDPTPHGQFLRPK
jgi:hypothetical protein